MKEGVHVTKQQFEHYIRQIQTGDKDGLKEIYNDYITFIYSIIFSIVHNKENAEDITSEFFIKLWTAADSYRFGGRHKAWLASIAHNMAIDFLRKYHKENIVRDIPKTNDNSEDSPENQVIEKMSLKEALTSLEEKEEQIINLKILGQLTFKEIAKILHMPMGTVTWKYQNGIVKLRRSGYGT